MIPLATYDNIIMHSLFAHIFSILLGQWWHCTQDTVEGKELLHLRRIANLSGSTPGTAIPSLMTLSPASPITNPHDATHSEAKIDPKQLEAVLLSLAHQVAQVGL